MIKLWMAAAIIFAGWTGTASASDSDSDSEGFCSTYGYTASDSDLVSAGYKKYFCLAKDSCGHTYIPECGKACFDHAVIEAVDLCKEQSNDPLSCEVIVPRNGESCDTDRTVLERKAVPKKK
jgi:hypothetical protein